MTPRQRLLRVELPLAAPVIMAGIRTAAVWTIGAATLSTPVGQTSLGNYIFSGLQTENWVFVLFGCAAAAALALVVDQLLGLIEAGLARRDRRRIWAGLAGVAAGTAIALASAHRPARQAAYVIGRQELHRAVHPCGTDVAAAGSPGRDGRSARTGSARPSRSARSQAAISTSTSIIPARSGPMSWSRRDVPSREADAARDDTLDGASATASRVLGSLGFENAYALAMRRERAAALGVKSIDDLARHAPQLALGADLEFLSRPEWAKLKEAYGLDFRAQRSFNPTFMYRALADGNVDVISAFSSDGRIAAQDLVVLEDPKHAIPSYDALVLISPRRANDGSYCAGAFTVDRQDFSRTDARGQFHGRSRYGQGLAQRRGRVPRPHYRLVQSLNGHFCRQMNSASGRRERLHREIALRIRPGGKRCPAGTARQRAKAIRPCICSCFRCGWSRRHGIRSVGRNMHRLTLAAGEVHFHPAALAVVERLVAEAAEIEVCRQARG